MEWSQSWIQQYGWCCQHQGLLLQTEFPQPAQNSEPAIQQEEILWTYFLFIQYKSNLIQSTYLAEHIYNETITLGRRRNKIRARKVASWNPMTTKIVVIIWIQSTPEQSTSLKLNLMLSSDLSLNLHAFWHFTCSSNFLSYVTCPNHLHTHSPTLMPKNVFMLHYFSDNSNYTHFHW